MSARGNLPEIVSKLFTGLLQLMNIFQHVHRRRNNFEINFISHVTVALVSSVCVSSLSFVFFVL